MIWWIIPTIVCLCIKASVIWYSRRAVNESKVFINLVCLIAVLNLIEVLAFSQFVRDSSPLFMLRMYYVTLVTVFAYICFYAIEIAQIVTLNKSIKYIALITAIIVALSLFSNQLVAGYKDIGYSITAIKGPHYWVFRVFTLASLFFALISMIVGYFLTNNEKIQIRCAYGASSILLIVLVMTSVIVLQLFNVKMNAMGILPIATTFFVLITLYMETKHKLTDIRPFIPFSPERKAASLALKLITACYGKEISHKETVDRFEQLIIMYHYEKNNYNKSLTAKALNITRPTLHRKMQELGIKPPPDI